MIREGRNPELFSKWKRQYSLSIAERVAIRDSLSSFLVHLGELGVSAQEFEFDANMIQFFSLHYGLGAPDALHLAMASKVCNYFVTNDDELIKKDIKEIHVLLPSTFWTLTALRRR